MNGASTVPGKVIDAAAGTDTTVTFETNKGTWEIEGTDIPEDTSALSLRVTTTGKLPEAAEEVADEADDALTVKVSKTFETNGVKASLTVDTDKDNAGKAADIYAVNADGELEFVTSVPVNKDGSVTLPVEDASQYVVAISDEGALDEGWQKNDKGEWVYGTADGTAATGWYKDSTGTWYHSDEHGIMETGWITDTDGKEYYLNASGAMRTGWLYEDGEWYFFGTSGAKVESGWVLSGGKWYYMQADGTMMTSGVTPDGYRVDADGVWIA
ncbi:MAG: N-acetylmuramoyl-L-alanine amidase family protein [Oscillospiraceae bacterium]|nr:N-acetylmuramoyl-L-alanine amidase family protein [Oscillospiraceae bacterium]